MKTQYADLIREHQQFRDEYKAEWSYDFAAPEYILLKQQYHIDWLVRDSDLDTALQLLHWLNRNVKHDGSGDLEASQDALTLLKAAYQKENGLNCFQLSTILTECLLALGIRARLMQMMPMAVEDEDNHVVAEVYSDSLHRWIMLDPTYGSYCTDRSGRILNLGEMRAMAAEGQRFFFSETINYNGSEVRDLEDVRDYYTKNLFFFRCKEKQGYGAYKNMDGILEIAPLGFDVPGRMTENIRFRIKNYGEFPYFLEWMENEKAVESRYIGIGQLYSSCSLR